MDEGTRGTDDWGVPGQITPGRPIVAAAGAVLVAGLLAGCSGGDPRDAAVVLSGVRAATVTSAAGSVVPARDGMRLSDRDRVTTAANGAATLTARDRQVLLAGATEVTVPDGASLEVRKGSVLVDRRRGPGIDVTVAEVRVSDIAPGAVRIDRGFTVGVRVYSGSAEVRTTSGRRADVGALYGLRAAGTALPTPTPLELVHDAWEREVIESVVLVDERLTAIARDLDATPRTTAVPALFGAAPVIGPTSESVLPVAIGRAARIRGDEAQRVQRARELRDARGSWGVVAALLEAPQLDIGRFLDQLTAGGGASVGGPGGTGAPGSGGGAQPGTTPGPAPTSSPGPTGSASPSPTPSPTTPSPTPDPVESVIASVEDLLPTPVPSLVPDLPLL